MSVQSRPVETKTQVKTQDAPELNSNPCWHCEGEGECECDRCAPSLDTEYHAAYRDDYDSGRQMECTCKTCLGLGRLTPDGMPLIEEENVDLY